MQRRGTFHPHRLPPRPVVTYSAAKARSRAPGTVVWQAFVSRSVPDVNGRKQARCGRVASSHGRKREDGRVAQRSGRASPEDVPQGFYRQFAAVDGLADEIRPAAERGFGAGLQIVLAGGEDQGCVRVEERQAPTSFSSPG